MNGPNNLHFIMRLVFNFCQKYMDGLYSLHFLMRLVSNLNLLKPLGLLVGDKIRYKVQTTRTIRVLLKS
ncbi:hypothetical protein Hanom_Chr10g00894331 [Helianthus anomalus]